MSKEEALLQAGRIIASDYIKSNGHLIPLSFGPEEHEHVSNILASALQTKHNYGYQGGGFVQSLVKNELYESLSKADRVVQRHLAVLAAGVYHISFNKIQEKADEIWNDSNC